tara:strand:- start:457 stop:657 length:201 start_codon:yes stop_codon:yes gene_type:complete
MWFDRFDIVEAHYWFYAENHSGQSCFMHERLCRISEYYRPSPMHVGFDSLNENSQEIYKSLEEKHR